MKNLLTVFMLLIATALFAYDTNVDELRGYASTWFDDALVDVNIVLDNQVLNSKKAWGMTRFNKDGIPYEIVMKTSYPTLYDAAETYFHELTHFVQYVNGMKRWGAGAYKVPKDELGVTPHDVRFPSETEAELVGQYLIGVMQGKRDDGSWLYINKFLKQCSERPIGIKL